MSEPPNEETRPRAGQPLTDAIRGNALGLVIGGGICLYFGFAFVADAPSGVSEEERAMWFALDNGLFWALRVVGIGFLLAGAWAASGRRPAMLLAAATEAAFALVMLAMSIAWTLEARVMGTWNPQVILLLILLIVGLLGARRSWELYTSTRRVRQPATTDDA
jgi:hypothetical protein